MPTPATDSRAGNDRSLPARARPPLQRPPLPPKVGYYLRHVLAGRYRLVPAEATPPPVKGRALTFRREQLRQIPESPQFQETLGQLDGTVASVTGWLHPGVNGSPVLFLDGLGGWTLRLPKHGKAFQELRELRSPDALRPWRSYEDPEHNRRPLRRRHLIPLRYHEQAFLVIAVTRYPSSHVGYEAWVWHAARRVDIPLSWEEAQRCIGLFRDLAASWFWTEGTPRTRVRPGGADSRPVPDPAEADGPRERAQTATDVNADHPLAAGAV